jgi:hypothetical protein
MLAEKSSRLSAAIPASSANLVTFPPCVEVIPLMAAAPATPKEKCKFNFRRKLN